MRRKGKWIQVVVEKVVNKGERKERVKEMVEERDGCQWRKWQGQYIVDMRTHRWG